ncbi:MAG TPA: YkgJ family cysteine cluster protein [Gemmatimonadales bacterium]|nr:YkgJ family cysteine cluster protein [Gemmatimonadales bacterium]
MARYTRLPDPFVKELEAIPGFLELTTGYSLCGECERCERSVVYLTPHEQAEARSEGLPLYGRGAATRMNRQGCRCPFYGGASRGCLHYTARPLICHLFPIDIVEHEDDGSHWWVLFGACAEVARGKLAGRVEEARRVAAEIDRRLPDQLRRAFVADAAGAVFEPVFYDHPIHYLLPLTLPRLT